MDNAQLMELIQKAVITTNALAAGGKLNPVQANKFIDYVWDETSISKDARTVRFSNETMEIDKITVGRRATVPKSEAKDPGHRRGISTSKVTLQPKELMTSFEIGDNIREVNIEGDSIEDTIVRLMATRTGNDIEELYLNGNTTGPADLESNLVDDGDSTRYVKDTFLALTDGWARLADGGHQVDMEGANIGLTAFGRMFRALPTKFQKNKRALRWFGSPNLCQLFREKLGSRATALGDSAISGNADSIAPLGIKFVEIPLWPFEPPVVENVTFTGSGSTVSLSYTNVSEVVVLPETLASTPTSAYSDSTDYTLDATAGTITHAGGGSTIGATATVKVTYKSPPQLILTQMSNLLVAIGRDVRIEKDRDIFKGVNQYAITTKVDVQVEELDCIVKGINFGNGI